MEMTFLISGRKIEVTGCHFQSKYEDLAKTLLTELIYFLSTHWKLKSQLSLDDLIEECQIRVDNSFNSFRMRFYEIWTELDSLPKM